MFANSQLRQSISWLTDNGKNDLSIHIDKFIFAHTLCG